MTDPIDNPAADIAWMRRLAEEGGQAPMQGASILFAGGAIFGVASLIQWAAIAGLLPISPNAASLVWLAAMLVFFVALAVALRHLKRQPGVTTTANRASGIAWSAMGWGIFALFVSFGVVGYQMEAGSAKVLFGLAPSVILVFYGVGWAVSAVMHKARPLWTLSFGSFIAAPVLAAFSGSALQYLAYAAALFLFMALPGFLLMRAAKRV